jgi:hypothetical protein
VVELWSGGDPVVQPLVAEARTGLARTDEGAPVSGPLSEAQGGS